MNRRTLLRSAGALAAGCASGAATAVVAASVTPSLATEAVADPCLAFVTEWQALRDQLEAAPDDAFYNEHVKPLEDQSSFGTIPAATTARGALSALQMILRIAEVEGEMSSLEPKDANLIRAALAYLEGAAA